MFRFSFSVFLLSWGLLSAYGQSMGKKPAKLDTVKNKYLPTGLRVGTDVITLLRSRDHSFKGWELTFDTDLSRYYFTMEYGYWATSQSLDNNQLTVSSTSSTLRTSGHYQNEGHYLRVGADINFLLKDPDKNMVFFGMRYALSNFSENLQYENQPSYAGFEPYSANLSNESVTGSWLEITSGLRVKIVSGFWMGYTARLKFAPSTSGATHFNAYDMPGYGIIQKAPYWGFNYQLFWRFGWKKPTKKNKS